MTEQFGRRRTLNVSQRIVAIVDERSRRSFRRWRSRFSKALAKPGRMAAWDTLIQAGCTPLDLEGVLYWAVDTQDSHTDTPAQLDSFHSARDMVRRDVDRLKRSCEKLAKAPFHGEPAVDAIWKLNGGKGKKDFESFLSRLPQFEKAVELLVVRKIGVKESQSSSSEGEAFVHMYVEEFSGRMFSESVSVLLEATSEAYGLDGLKFTLEAVSQRYSRFRKKHPREFAEVRRCVKAYKTIHSTIWRGDILSFIAENLITPRLLSAQERFRAQKTL